MFEVIFEIRSLDFNIDGDFKDFTYQVIHLLCQVYG